jgi:hypothetical protein
MTPPFTQLGTCVAMGGRKRFALCLKLQNQVASNFTQECLEMEAKCSSEMTLMSTRLELQGNIA